MVRTYIISDATSCEGWVVPRQHVLRHRVCTGFRFCKTWVTLLGCRKNLTVGSSRKFRPRKVELVGGTSTDALLNTICRKRLERVARFSITTTTVGWTSTS